MTICIYINIYKYIYIYIYTYKYIYIYIYILYINERLEGYSFSMSVFNLSKRVLTEAEIRVSEKGLGFAPKPTK